MIAPTHAPRRWLPRALALLLPLFFLAAEALALPIRVRPRGRRSTLVSGTGVRIRPGHGGNGTVTGSGSTRSRVGETSAGGRFAATRRNASQGGNGGNGNTTSGASNSGSGNSATGRHQAAGDGGGSTTGRSGNDGNGAGGTGGGDGVFGIGGRSGTGGPPPSIRSRLRDAGLHGLPGGRRRGSTGPYRFRAPEGYSPGQRLRTGRNGGYLDRFGNEWVEGPYHGKPGLGFHREWDVILSPQGQAAWGRHASPGRGGIPYLNVRPDGFLSH